MKEHGNRTHKTGKFRGQESCATNLGPDCCSGRCWDAQLGDCFEGIKDGEGGINLGEIWMNMVLCFGIFGMWASENMELNELEICALDRFQMIIYKVKLFLDRFNAQNQL